MRWDKSYLDRVIGDVASRHLVRIALPSDRGAALMRRALYRRLAATQGPQIEICQDGDVLTLRLVRQAVGLVLSQEQQK